MGLNLENTKAGLAVLSLLLAASGMVLVTVGYASFYVFLHNLDSAVVPQIDATVGALSGLQPAADSVSQSAESASEAIGPLAGALATYSESSGEVSDSLTSLSMVPPFSLDKRVASSAGKMREASVLFSNASQTLNSSASSAVSAAASIREASGGLDRARESLLSAKSSFRSAIGMLQIGALAAYLSLLAFLSSAITVSLSVLVSHYPRFFEKRLPAESRKGAPLDWSAIDQNLNAIETDLTWLEEEMAHLSGKAAGPQEGQGGVFWLERPSVAHAATEGERLEWRGTMQGGKAVEEELPGERGPATGEENLPEYPEDSEAEELLLQPEGKRPGNHGGLEEEERKIGEPPLPAEEEEIEIPRPPAYDDERKGHVFPEREGANPRTGEEEEDFLSELIKEAAPDAAEEEEDWWEARKQISKDEMEWLENAKLGAG